MTNSLQYKRGGTVKYFVVVRDTYNEIKQKYEIEAADILEAAGRVRARALLSTALYFVILEEKSSKDI